ncbi:hypothetical protein H6G89_10380 [Oscillatoria sp. FACHB-1407]|uniref:hypothetical protein n=1 Tax=Oscillatoria sp. FACHB-1407 TaxID=2692847 RepID=UPI001688CF20|nr:hypothetical protein [Oscillatoria sp. FACHB-1407]MBD2461455.1 hypothetical protein [Oscillatoria sp. FACHB-1407]
MGQPFFERSEEASPNAIPLQRIAYIAIAKTIRTCIGVLLRETRLIASVLLSALS